MHFHQLADPVHLVPSNYVGLTAVDPPHFIIMSGSTLNFANHAETIIRDCRPPVAALCHVLLMVKILHKMIQVSARFQLYSHEN